ncbi:MAG: uroporphyrinogen decarboxylase family protein [Clostridiales bacterium]
MLREKERLIHTLRQQAVDRPPFICPGGMMNLVTREMMEKAAVYWPEGHQNPEAMAKLAMAAWQEGCFENYGLPFCMTVEAEGMGAKVDMGSLTCEPHVVGYAISTVKDWRVLPMLDCGSGRARVTLEAIRLLHSRAEDIPIIGNLTGPISLAGSLLDPVIFYRELRKEKEEAREFLNFICRSLINFGLCQMEEGADIIAISDPSGSGEILGPKLFGEYVVPALNRIIDALQESCPHCQVIVHICGKMHKVYGQLQKLHCKAISFDALVNLREARAALPGKVIMGNISTYALEFAGIEKIQGIVGHCLSSGANIVAPACGLGINTPIENLRAAQKKVQGAV